MDGPEDLGQALATSVPTVRPYLAHRGATFGDLVTAKRQNRLEATP